MLVTTHISFGLILFIVSLIDFRVGCTVALQHLLGCTVAIGTHASALTLLHSRFCTRAFARTLLHSLFGTYTSAFNRMHIGHRRSHFGTHSSVLTRGSCSLALGCTVAIGVSADGHCTSEYLHFGSCSLAL